ncbi:MAG: metal ABC transporter substrate-binding protein [Candidatus Omnitrophota bacterium]
MLISLRKFFVLTIFPIAVFGSFLAGGTETVYAAPVLKVVTSTSIYTDLVKKIGGENVEARFVASPRFNVHFIQPKPSDVRNVARADLFVFSGLDLEAWADPLLEAAGKPVLFRGGDRNLDLSQGIRLLEVPQGNINRSQGDIHLFGNPHYWMNPENLKMMAENVAAKLSEIDPANESLYRGNLRSFLERLDAKIAEWKNICAHCAGKEIVSYHKDIEYLADFLGVRVSRYIEPMPGIPPTAKHLASLENYMKQSRTRIIVKPTFYPQGAAESVAERTGGEVRIICQNVSEKEGTGDIFAFFDTNIHELSEALKR